MLAQAYDPNYKEVALRTDATGALIVVGGVGGGGGGTPAAATVSFPIGAPSTYSAIALAGGTVNVLTLPAGASSALLQAIEPIYWTAGDPATNPTDLDFQLAAGEQLTLNSVATINAFRARSINATVARVRVQFFGV